MNTQIKPETLVLLEKNAERFGLSVDEYLRSLLPKEEKELALKGEDESPISPAEKEAKRQKSIAWIQSHREKYGGLYVALDGDFLIGTGKKYGDALKLALEKGYQKAFVAFVHPTDYIGSWGGWV